MINHAEYEEWEAHAKKFRTKMGRKLALKFIEEAKSDPKKDSKYILEYFLAIELGELINSGQQLKNKLNRKI